MCIPCFFTISTSEVGVVESWGKFSRLVQPGLACVLFRKYSIVLIVLYVSMVVMMVYRLLFESF